MTGNAVTFFDAQGNVLPRAAESAIIDQDGSGAVQAFTFGDDVSVLGGRELWGAFEGVYSNADWWEPPVPMVALAKSYRMSPHHQAAVKLKVNLLKRHFKPTRWLSAEAHERLALDLIQMGNFYAEEVRNLGGRVMELRVAPAIHMRVGVEPGRYFWTQPHPLGLGTSTNGAHEFAQGSVHHVFEPDVVQEIYGLPEWLSALQSGLLNENATLFRRRYYLNGAHAGFVFYMSEPTVGEEDAKAIRDALGRSKGVGNFKNLFLHVPNGKKDGVQIMPIAEVAAKDEFAGIKNITRDDMLAAHRVPPQLIGVIPQNNGGFGDVRSAMDVFFLNEIVPLMAKMLQLNDRAGVPAVAYQNYTPMMPQGGAPAAR
jgi:PBSX family phage portal protein